MKKYFLTTALMGTIIAPAFGADKIITSANTCTVDVLGVSDNNATANTIATWDLIDYTLDPGQYLSVTETSVDKATCPSGSYCVGGGFTVETADNSIAQCPTGYPNSANGASADTQCYTACTVANANIAHATAVSGNDYYGTGTDTCGATACETGYHVDGGIELVEKEPLIPVDYQIVANASIEKHLSGAISYGGAYGDMEPPTEKGTWYGVFDYGTVYGRSSCQPKRNPAYEYIISNAEALMGGLMTMEEFKAGLKPLLGATKTDFVVDMLDGTKTKDEQEKAIYALLFTEKDANYSTDSVGRYCYVQVNGFEPIDGEKIDVMFLPWVYHSDYDSDIECSQYCGPNLDMFLERAALYGVLDYTETGTCTANTINIDWNPDNGGKHTINQCTYEGSVTLPTPDPVKPGYTFTGWKLVDGTTTE